MSPSEQAEYNKVCHELDELKGDLIEEQNESQRLRHLLIVTATPKETLQRTIQSQAKDIQQLLSRHNPAVGCSWAGVFILCLVLTASIISNYQLRQELTFWKCQPPYQSPSSPVEN
ncbi:hypothetical protein UFOVP991_12 [uncultured Caudovirales phage]|uniref:Uncharacterized protein n=1 Tax=uncultured Caudovirales phage TaxID=2100421 RepID=A0A6J5QE75_9CAUD|nr:hypothetical protein UFOVP991_12 [uncultured Caudovirales phage]CAB4182553.1 hypothetical protein UFOVP1076_12 [uncultured Caudovirales phage]CAB4198235.1 hypothetical protein UFOVP1314_55 [uncultured Caudovirales phage]CAB4211290.1 hypothetical protein UFOVP1427_15 [uncultured Caudovirales phage]CAB5237987.1 hypothetical protein UFOVP1523_19 [uncultured Caudovirales phage]